MIQRTKIVCTIGPAAESEEKIIELIDAGMNVARLNFSHGTYGKHAEIIQRLKNARDQTNQPLGIMLDTKGPEIRIGKIKNDLISLEKGQILKVTGKDVEGDHETIPIVPGTVLGSVRHGMHILFNDGYISCKVKETTPEYALVEVENHGDLQTGKGVNIPNAILDLPAMTERDIADITFGCEQDIDLIAASFIRSADHVIAIKKLLKDLGKPGIQVLAKIENTEGVQNFNSILHVADGIMIARGDLGVELPLSQVPRLQKMMIRSCYLVGKPSVTATQMLESMIHCPRPTRAEASDVANAIYDSTSAVMLSGETAVGLYPIESVKVMRSIIRESEKDFDYIELFNKHTQQVYHDVPSSVTMATVKTAYSCNAKAIFAFTKSGSTGRLLSRLRPEIPVVALTPNEKSYHQMALNWGVHPIYDKEDYESDRPAFKAISKAALDKRYVQYGDQVVLTAGSPFGVSGTTNMMIVENIGEVLVRGHEGYGWPVYGKVCLLLSTEEKKHYEVKDSILVITKCDDSYIPFFKQSLGIILENHISDEQSEKRVLAWARDLNIPALVRADRAFKTLSEGQRVTLDPQHALVCKGVLGEDQLLEEL